jgi:hypothetical protein
MSLPFRVLLKPEPPRPMGRREWTIIAVAMLAGAAAVVAGFVIGGIL